MKPAIRLFGVLLLLTTMCGAMSNSGQSSFVSTSPTFLPIIFRNTTGPTIAGCQVFPNDNIWNTPVNTLPVHANSSMYVNNIGASTNMHADFGAGVWPPGSDSPIGIPFVVVPGTQKNVAIRYTDYGNESDPGPFPIPTYAPVEGGPNSDGDRHVLVINKDTCKLYELYAAYPQPDGSWNASSGAKYDLNANGPLRQAGWTSADAAGLPILPGLVRYDEVVSGQINHAIRFTAPCTQNAYVWPARHRAGSCGTSYPPMGQRFRLKASFNILGAPASVQVILKAMQKYGLILADNGSAWYISGAPDERWNNDALHWLDSNLPGSAFEAVDSSSLMIDQNSGQSRQP